MPTRKHLAFARESPSARRTMAQFPTALQFLFEPHRYKVAYGGRGGAKSWGFARALLIQGAGRPLRILCAREIQKSIADSVHTLLADQIAALGLQGHYDVQETVILGANGTEFIFAGLKHNINNIKGIEGCDIVWVEEAHVVSRGSWEVLVPTIRKAGSEIWVTFNPNLEMDETYQRFVVKAPPPGAVVRKLTYRDNAWFPEVLRAEMEYLRDTDPAAYDHVWEGMCLSTVTGAVYHEQMRAAEAEGRMTRVPHNPMLPVHTFWDLGFGDMVAIWMAQATGVEYHVIDYLEDHRKDIPYFIRKLQERPYLWGTDWLPWDAKAGQAQLATGKSIEEIIRGTGRTVRVVPRMPVADGINAVRTTFPLCWFDKEKCADGLHALRHYRWTETAQEIARREPLHDWACFEMSTLVLTRYGTRRIIDLPENGEVLTPCGWKRYQGPRITRRNAPLVEVRFGDGSTVRCTPDHLFLTVSGWKSAKSLQKGTLIQSSLTRSRSILMAVSTAYGLAKGTLREAAKSFIGMCGNWLSGISLSAAISTIGMESQQTTGSPIWSASQLLNTPHSQTTSEELPRSATWHVKELLSGIARMLGGSGIVATQSAQRVGRNGSGNGSSVLNAARRSMRWFATVVTRKSSAPRYAKPLLIENVRPVDERTDVGCIHVEDGHWFTLANGAVVHNSHAADAFRTFAVAIGQPKRARKEYERVPAGQISSGRDGGWMT